MDPCIADLSCKDEAVAVGNDIPFDTLDLLVAIVSVISDRKSVV